MKKDGHSLSFWSNLEQVTSTKGMFDMLSIEYSLQRGFLRQLYGLDTWSVPNLKSMTQMFQRQTYLSGEQLNLAFQNWAWEVGKL